jgi:hypothetical protein
MFLNYLTKENKENFLKLCVCAAMANEVFSEEEKETFDLYCREMGLETHIPDMSENVDDLIAKIFSSTRMDEKNIIALEILSLLKCDGVYDDDEKIFMDKLAKGLRISDDKILKLEYLLDKYIEIGKELYTEIEK